MDRINRIVAAGLILKIFASRKAFVFESRGSKVYQQSHFDARGVEIIDDLSLMFGCNGFDGLQFNNHLLFNNEITIKVTDALPSEQNLYGMLSYR